MHCLPGDSVTHICSLKVVWHFPWHAAFPKSSWNVFLLSLCFSLQDSRQEGPGNPHPWLTDHLWIKPFSVQPAGDFKPPIANSRCPLILWANRQSGTKHSNVSTCIPRSFLLGAVWLRDRCIYDSSLLFFSLCSDQFPCGPVWFPSDIFSSNSLVMWWLRFSFFGLFLSFLGFICGWLVFCYRFRKNIQILLSKTQNESNGLLSGWCAHSSHWLAFNRNDPWNLWVLPIVQVSLVWK